MKLKDYLKARNDIVPVTEEVLFPVVVGVGTFVPFHTGYLPMLTKMVSESANHKCDAIVIVIESSQSDFVVAKLKEMAPGLRIMVTTDVSESLSKLSMYQRAPLVIYSDDQNAPIVKTVCEQMFPMSALEVNTDSYLTKVERKMTSALREGDFLKFNMFHIDCPLIESRTMFSTLRSLNGFSS